MKKKLNNFLFKNLFFWFIQHLMILLFYFLQPKFDSLILFENQIQVNKYELIYYFPLFLLYQHMIIEDYLVLFWNRVIENYFYFVVYLNFSIYLVISDFVILK